MSALFVLHGIATCDTVRKARRWLDAQSVVYRYHDLRKDGVTRGQVASWVGQVGWQKMLNRSGTTFRKLSEEDKLVSDEAEAIALMLLYPATIRRPVLEYKDRILVGFSPEAYTSLLSLHDRLRTE